MHSREEKLEAFGRFLDVLDTLREKCPLGQETDEREFAAEHDRGNL